MKPGRLKRGSGPTRRAGLRPDPAKVREWQQRSRQALRRKRPQRPAEGPLSPEDWRREVAHASKLACRVTGTRARDAFDRRFHAHHLVPKEILRARGLHDRVWDPRNGMLVTGVVHVRHEDAVERIPRETVPESAWEFARELGPWAVNRIARFHPPREEHQRG